MNADNRKDFSAELETINNINSLAATSTTIYQNGQLISEGTIINQNGKLALKCGTRFKDDFVEFIALHTCFGDIYTTLDIINDFRGLENGIMKTEVTCSFRFLKSAPFSPDFSSRFRCFIPTPPSKLNTFRFHLETIRHCTRTHNYNLQCVRIQIDAHQFDILQIKSGDRGYYVIDSFQEMPFDVFGDYCFAIQQALGFIMGYMPGGEIYYFSQENEFYHTYHIRAAMDSLYCPLYTNPHGNPALESSIAEKYKNKLDILSAKEFSKLVSTIFSNLRFSSVILMLIEATSTHTLLLMPSIYAIILESLSKIICTDIPKELKPVNDKKLFQKISCEIRQIIDSHRDEYGTEDDIQRLERRIPALNNPLNRLTNDEKLLAPFDRLGIQLTPEDLRIIRHRNDLLHGNSHLTDDDNTPIDSVNNYVLYTTEKLYTLISALILKYIGYSGYIINHAKLTEKKCGIDSSEEYYIRI